MNLKIITLIALVSLWSFAHADEITQCSHFEVPVNYDAANFKYKEMVDSTGWDEYHYLMDSIFIKNIDGLELWADIDVFLFDNKKALIRYEEATWRKNDSTSRSLVEKTFEAEFESSWRSNGNQLFVDQLGQGQSAKCFDDGQFDVYFKYQNNLGPSSIANKQLILHYGYSTYDPFK